MGTTNYIDATPLDEALLQRLATIVGPGSAAADAIRELERRRAAGEAVAVYKGRGRHRGVLFVGPVIPLNPV